MAAEVPADLSKAQKRELKWERKQAKAKAAAVAAGQPYLVPSKETKADATDKIGKRKKRKLAALQQGGACDTPLDGKHLQPHAVQQQQPLQAAGAAQNGLTDDQGTAKQSKADRKAAKAAAKAAQKAAAGEAAARPASQQAAVLNGTADSTPKKKKKKSTSDLQPADSPPASAEPSPKKQKKHSHSANPKGRVKAHQEAVLASVGDRDLAKSGKGIQKALYQEHLAVSAMSPEEVTRHRADRDTTVSGVDMRPVLQFDQAGVAKICVLRSLVFQLWSARC